MEIGIIGLPGSGKTTLFNAVTRGHAAVSEYASKPNVGVAQVPDDRLDTLARMYDPRKPRHAVVAYFDIPPPTQGMGRTRAIAGQYLNDLQRVDALLIAARAFDDKAVVHMDGTVDPFRDVENMMIELLFSDLDLVERRLLRLDERYKGANVIDRGVLNAEREILERIQEQLELEVPIRDQHFSSGQADKIREFRFLTSKPMIVVFNIDEGKIEDARQIEQQMVDRFSGDGVCSAAICGKIEMELAQLDPSEEDEFRESMGAHERGWERIIRMSYDLIGLISFLTIGDDEVRAWSVPAGIIAHKAAGKIHSDFEHGFIRAEIVHYDDLIECGSLSEARKRGVLRQEGKDYVIKDGDVMRVLFNL